MYKLNEVDPDQRYIPNEEFYRRYTFEYRARNLQPKPGLQTCVCHIPYNPNDTDPLNLMHFCPRPSCRKAYHHQCLWADKSKESLSASKKDRTAKIPSFEVSSTESDIGSVVIVKRSARKHAAPPPKVAARKTKSVKKIVELADEQVKTIFTFLLLARIHSPHPRVYPYRQYPYQAVHINYSLARLTQMMSLIYKVLSHARFQIRWTSTLPWETTAKGSHPQRNDVVGTLSKPAHHPK